MKHCKLKTGKGELNSTGGNHLCGLLLGHLPDRTLPANFQPRRSDAIADRDILLSQVGLLCSDFSDINLYRDDEVFMNAYGLRKVASEPVFRQRFDDLPAKSTHAALRRLNTRLLSRRSFGQVDADGLGLVPVDMDVSPMDNSGSSKQGVSFTYNKYAGYAPMFAYIGTEGYMLDCELRPGSQHCQSGTPDFIRRSRAALRGLGLEGQCLYRLATGNDASENFDVLGNEYFLIKRNLRRESREQWLALGTDPFKADTDGDGCDDPVEVAAGTDPLDGTFFPAAGPAVTYVDATTNNTTLADGTACIPEPEGITGADNLWELRTYGNGGQAYESNGETGEDAPCLKTVIDGLVPGQAYDLFVYCWGDDADYWRIRCGLFEYSAELESFISNDPFGSSSTHASPVNFNASPLGSRTAAPLDGHADADGRADNGFFANGSHQVLIKEGNRNLFQASIGARVADSNGCIAVRRSRNASISLQLSKKHFIARA